MNGYKVNNNDNDNDNDDTDNDDNDNDDDDNTDNDDNDDTDNDDNDNDDDDNSVMMIIIILIMMIKIIWCSVTDAYSSKAVGDLIAGAVGKKLTMDVIQVRLIPRRGGGAEGIFGGEENLYWRAKLILSKENLYW